MSMALQSKGQVAIAAKNTVSIRRRLLNVYVGAFLVFLYLPIALLIALSFNDSDVMIVSFRGLTLRWYETVLTSRELMASIGRSIIVGLVSSTIATTLAVLLAFGLRHEFRFKALLTKIILLPVLIPGVVGGVVYLMFFGYIGVSQGLWRTVLPVHVTWVLPFAFLTIFPRIHSLPRNLEEAAMDLGATRAKTFLRIILPSIRPAMVATILFGFTLSFDEFIRSFFIVGRDQTVPVHLWVLLSDQMAPFLPAVGVIVMLISIAASLIGFVVSAWADRRGSAVS